MNKGAKAPLLFSYYGNGADDLPEVLNPMFFGDGVNP